MSSLPGFTPLHASTEAPLEMLSACHGRVERQCETLLRLGPHLQLHGADLAAREAAQAILRYFDQAAVHHHADEEADLFPALLGSMAGSDAVCLRQLTAGLTQDHRHMERQWQALRALLQPLAKGQPMTWDEALVRAFVGAYRQHIEREETELLPMAQRLLDEASLQAIGRAMRERRGIAAID